MNGTLNEKLSRKAEETAVTVGKKEQPVRLTRNMSIADMIRALEPEIKRALPSVITPERFIRMALSAINNTPKLSECTPMSFIAAMMNAAQLGLEPNTPLGQAYLIPYKNHGTLECQFQLGYKGYIQLAIRSGQYRKLNVLPVKAGELVRYDPILEEIEINLIEDEVQREKAPTAGYYAMFEYINGFRKALYWSREKMEKHAQMYSKGYNAKKGYTFWEKDFDAMACKTMLRQLISKWGIMSIEMQEAVEKDMGVIQANGDVNFIDAENADIEVEAEAAETEADGTEPAAVSMEEL